jgi:hypothetical protein
MHFVRRGHVLECRCVESVPAALSCMLECYRVPMGRSPRSCGRCVGGCACYRTRLSHTQRARVGQGQIYIHMYRCCESKGDNSGMRDADAARARGITAGCRSSCRPACNHCYCTCCTHDADRATPAPTPRPGVRWSRSTLLYSRSIVARRDR